MPYIRPLIAALISIALISAQGLAQGKAEIGAISHTYDFGLIPESDNGAEHTFRIANTGSAALVINNVSTSCGCARPDWTRRPIAPGDSGEVRVHYISKGRPGPFYKSVIIHSNASTSRLTLYIKGTVSNRKAEPPPIELPYRAGNLKLETKSISFGKIFPGETGEETIRIKNDGPESLNIAAVKTPPHLTVECSPQTLNPGETGEISMSLRADVIKRMGRIDAAFNLEITENNARKTNCPIAVKANIIESFKNLSPSEKANAPAAQYSSADISFGKVSDKAPSLIPFIGSNKESAQLRITNTGKSPLHIYSITCDNEQALTITGGKREIKPGASATCKIVIHPKAIKAKFEDFIHIVSNDPAGPVRLVKVTAEK
jgi:hypothetical protein